MNFNSRNEHIRYLVNFYSSRSNKMFRENRVNDARALAKELDIGDNVNQWLFIRNICNERN